MDAAPMVSSASGTSTYSLLLPADIAHAGVAANRIIEMRKKDQNDGRLVSLDVGDLGRQDGGVRIDFRNVWFRYPTRDVPILNGLTMTVSCPSVVMTFFMCVPAY